MARVQARCPVSHEAGLKLLKVSSAAPELHGQLLCARAQARKNCAGCEVALCVGIAVSGVGCSPGTDFPRALRGGARQPRRGRPSPQSFWQELSS